MAFAPRGGSSLPPDPDIEPPRKKAKSRPRALRTDAFSRFTGYYRIDPAVTTNSVILVTHEQGQLFTQEIGRPRMPLSPAGPDVFTVTGSKGQYRFIGPPDRPADHMVVGKKANPVIATRTDAADAQQAAADYARELEEQARPRTPIAIGPEALEAYPGIFMSALGNVVEVTRRESCLFAQREGGFALEILPEGQHRFFYPGRPMQIIFQTSEGSAEALSFHQSGRAIHYRRTSHEAAAEVVEKYERRRAEQERPRLAITLSPDMLRRYAGRYHLNHRASLTVTLENGRLFGEMTNQRPFEMFAETEACFFLTIGAVQISFIENASGRIDRAVVHQNGHNVLMMREIPEGEDS